MAKSAAPPSLCFFATGDLRRYVSKKINNLFVTILVGVSIFVTGQIVIKFIIDPIHEFRKLLGEIKYELIFHAQAIQTPMGTREREDEASNVLRKLSCHLLSRTFAIPFYRGISLLMPKFLPPKENINDASKWLIGLSNSVHSKNRSDNYKKVNRIEKMLNI